MSAIDCRAARGAMFALLVIQIKAKAMALEQGNRAIRGFFGEREINPNPFPYLSLLGLF